MASEEKLFNVPVDTEHKALRLQLLSFARPHMRAFYIGTLGHFIAFLSTFSSAALIPIIREALSLSGEEVGQAGIAAVTGTIVARVLMGSVCDVVGPRLGMAAVLLLTSPCVFGMALANTAIDFTMLRFGMGFALASFVACQFWTSCMFNVRIVGFANATAGGWGNAGGGATQLVMPLIYRAMTNLHEPAIAWRWSFFIPGAAHIAVGLLILFFATDLPDGNYALLKKSGAVKADNNGWAIVKAALSNYRLWCLIALYGFSFGIELTVNNIIVTYLFDQFGISLTLAGILASLFGLMNVFSRSMGGLSSDIACKRYGMRGRLWTLWTLQAIAGVLCIGLGLAKASLAATIVLLVVFPIFVQAAEGATFGIVPFVSKRALGVVSGLVGAGGNLGAVIAQVAFFQGNKYRTYDGIVYMGIMIIAVSLLVVPIYFPMWGGMFMAPQQDAIEEDYYLKEYSEEERAAGLADAALRFSQESKSQRGSRAGVKPAKAVEAPEEPASAAPAEGLS